MLTEIFIGILRVTLTCILSHYCSIFKREVFGGEVRTERNESSPLQKLRLHNITKLQRVQLLTVAKRLSFHQC